MKIAKDVTELIGNTPLVRLNKVTETIGSNVFAKLEYYNPGSSVKDRLGYAMIDDAEKRGILKPDSIVIEPTSGNTGIALAIVCAVRGYRLIVTMPESMSVERRNLIQSFGAEIVLTPAEEGMKGSIAKSHQLKEKYKHAFIPMQFDNQANVEMHRNTTAREILNDTDGNIDIFLAGVGTGGTITGVGEVLKEKDQDIQVVAVEPADSPVLSGGEPGKHKIQGIGAGFIPSIMNLDVIDEVFTVENEEAMEMARALSTREGIFSGISSGAIVHAAVEIGKRPENKDKNIVAIICDTGERYLSTPLYNPNAE
ncbi:MAG: cysteine synthase A [Bacteroidales bacterium]|nr:cysteine synthase A [Bacteroidales bacterium]MBS3774929.1 cysteine synthase A [Bacteroidales bacterium]